MDQAICPKCNLPVLTNFYFCPNCGNQLRQKSLPITIGKQIGIYLLSFFLPPLGLWPGFKYLLQKDQKAKIVGSIAIILTIISIIVTYFVGVGLLKQYNQILNQQLNVQLNPQF